MTIEIALLILIIAIAMALFSFERIPVDIVAVGVLLTLILTGLLPLEKAFLGFGSEVVVMIFGLLVLTAALMRTGVVEATGQFIVRRIGKDSNRLLLTVLVTAAAVSSLISNTAATAFFIPVILGMARKAKVSSSKLLLPLAFASILASSVTLIATSTNIVISGLITQYQLPPLGMFELTPVGLPIALAGIAYIYFFGRKLIPARVSTEDTSSEISSPIYLTEVILRQGSILAGRTLAETALGRDLDITVVRVIREDQRYLAPQSDLVLQVGDILLVEGKRNEILSIKNSAGIELRQDVMIDDPSLQNKDVRLAEAIILLRSPLVGRTLKSVQFRERYGLQVLAINRHGETIQNKISQTTLRLGDVLLIQGNRTNITALEDDQTFRIIGEIEDRRLNVRQASIAIIAFLLSLGLAAFEVVPLQVAVLIGVLIVLLTRCITPEQAYREVEWKAIILIGCMLSLGVALEYTGTASYLAGQIVSWTAQANPIILLGAFFVLTVILTQPMSNQAAAVVVLPIAIQTAMQAGLNPRSFAVMIAIAASTSYLTPLEPSCLMVYGPGRYKFADFLKVGSILTLIIFALAIWLVPAFWPL
jgi:di/tricarboxylate transporter